MKVHRAGVVFRNEGERERWGGFLSQSKQLRIQSIDEERRL